MGHRGECCSCVTVRVPKLKVIRVTKFKVVRVTKTKTVRVTHHTV